jgi:hypothetical protein
VKKNKTSENFGKTSKKVRKVKRKVRRSEQFILERISESKEKLEN